MKSLLEREMQQNSAMRFPREKSDSPPTFTVLQHGCSLLSQSTQREIVFDSECSVSSTAMTTFILHKLLYPLLQNLLLKWTQGMAIEKSQMLTALMSVLCGTTECSTHTVYKCNKQMRTHSLLHNSKLFLRYKAFFTKFIFERSSWRSSKSCS